MGQNFFVETVLARGVIRRLGDEEMEASRAPFRDPQSRWQTLVWPRQLPIEGQPPNVVAAVEQYGRWLAGKHLPKAARGRRAWRDGDGASPRPLPRVAQPDRADGRRQALPAGGLATRDRPRHRRVRSERARVKGGMRAGGPAETSERPEGTSLSPLLLRQARPG